MFFPFNLLTLSEELGSGAFGVVRKAELFDTADNTVSTVAVKMLKGKQLSFAFCDCSAYT